MGETVVKIKVSNFLSSESKEIEAIADTGVTYTTLPCEILDELGIERKEKVKLELADGKVIERDLGNVLLEVEGRLRANPVVFGEAKDGILIGLVTLESCGLTIDTINRKLIPLPKIHHYYLKRISLCVTV